MMSPRLNREPQLVSGVVTVRDGARPRRAAGLDDAIELDDGPALVADIAQRGDARLHIDAAASELGPLVSGCGIDRLHILQVHGGDGLSVLANRLDRIAAALLVMRDVEEEAERARRGIPPDPLETRR